MSLYREHGIVLRTYKLGEADRIVVLVTRGHGKVRAVAKGVRKTKSRFGSRLEPSSHVALQLYEGRELDIVTQAESVDHFRAIREDLDLLAGAQVMLEATDQVSQEREPDARLYQLLLGALRTLAGAGGTLVVPAFLLEAPGRRRRPATGRAVRRLWRGHPAGRLRPRVRAGCCAAPVAAASRSAPTRWTCCGTCSAAGSTRRWPSPRAKRPAR